jgi:hypothetical protein
MFESSLFLRHKLLYAPLGGQRYNQFPIPMHYLLKLLQKSCFILFFHTIYLKIKGIQLIKFFI